MIELSDRENFGTYAYAVQSSGIVLDEISGTLRSQGAAVSVLQSVELAGLFWDSLDSSAHEVLADFDHLNNHQFGIGLTGAITVGYLAWIVRGGVLLTTLMSSMPAWSHFDPLVVIEAADLDGEEGESIEQLVDG